MTAALLWSCMTLMSASPKMKGVDRVDRPDGITLLVAEDRSLPRVSFRIALRSGGAEDPDELQGLTRVTSELVLRGTKKHARRAFSELVEGYGSSLSGDSGSESQTWGGESLSRYFEKTFALLAEALLEPAFAQEELDKLVREMEAERTTRKDDDSTLSRLAFRRALYGAHVYGRDPLGTKASLAALTPEHLRKEHTRRLVRGNMIVAAAGDIDVATLSGLLDRYFAAIPAGASLSKEMAPTPEPTGITLYVVDKPERTQTQIILGRPALKGTNPDHLAMNVAATAFGGTFTAPLMHEIREVRGWSYGAYAAISEMRGRGGFSMVAAPATGDTVGCIELMVELYKKFWNGDYPASLFEFGRSYLLNQFPFNVATPDARVSEYLHAELMGYGDNWVQSFPDRLGALKPDAIRQMPKRYLSDTDFIIVIVATHKELQNALANLSFSPEIKVLPVEAE
ncbi:MAG: insulinase family protein [Deltaproteobacteria bacterium]|nr:insulinase family protein [Deltaproteobacteria bacterium]